MFRSAVSASILTFGLMSSLNAQTPDVETLAREYIFLPEIQQTFDEIKKPTIEFLLAELMLRETLSESQLVAIVELYSEEFDGLRDDINDAMVSASMGHFDENELSALIKFYQSEHGGSAMQKMMSWEEEVRTALRPVIFDFVASNAPKLQQILEND